MTQPLNPIQLKASMTQPPHPVLAFDLQGQLQGLTGLSADDLCQINWVTVPTQLVLFVETLVPGKSKSQWQQALPYAFEEHLAQPVDQVFFKVLARENSGLTRVAAVAKVQMQAWVETLQATGLSHVQLIADCFLLPQPTQTSELEKSVVWCAKAYPDNLQQFNVRNGVYSGFSGNLDWLEIIKSRAESNGYAVSFDFIGVTEKAPELSRADLKTFGLRDGAYQPKSQKKSKAKPWYLPLAAAGILLITWLGQVVWQTQELTQQRDLLEQQTTALFQQMFPNIKRIVNLQAQAKSALSQSGPDDRLGPIALSMVVEKVLKTQGNIEVQSLVWRGQELQFTLQADALATLQTVEQQLKQNPAFKVRLEVQTLESTKVSARLVIHV